ncbi:hypothetical protein FBF91_05875 [Campylobacter upsaliensis]|uniref:hypothetical protein n=1 Tax=Campylobacter upsaliensis TaxID=28080 RepID=UPI0012C926EA|nr:hypothetical protein [Campylobacter upsaliensis]EAK7296538.1 hypothetical protein [Campylobacter upsaliensis]MBJ6809584.1 hypothetical protein [Campylobacter upsaliensis]
MKKILRLFIELFGWVFWLAVFSVLASAILTLTGCSTKTQYKVKVEKVYIPVKCEVVKLPEIPKMKANVYHTLNDVLIYAEQLKVIVDGCVVEKKY